MPGKALPDWVKVDKKRFDRIKNKVQNAKDKIYKVDHLVNLLILSNQANYFKTKHIVILLMKKH